MRPRLDRRATDPRGPLLRPRVPAAGGRARDVVGVRSGDGHRPLRQGRRAAGERRARPVRGRRRAGQRRERAARRGGRPGRRQRRGARADPGRRRRARADRRLPQGVALGPARGARAARRAAGRERDRAADARPRAGRRRAAGEGRGGAGAARCGRPGRDRRSGAGGRADAAAEVTDAKHATDVVRIVRGIAIPGAVLALLGVLLTAGSAAAGLVRAGIAVGVATLLVVLSDALARASISASGETGQAAPRGLRRPDRRARPLEDRRRGGRRGAGRARRGVQRAGARRRSSPTRMNRRQAWATIGCRMAAAAALRGTNA